MINYPLAASTWGAEEIQAMQDVITTGNFTMGTKVKEFERRFAREVGSEFAVMVNSGSSANLALISAAHYRRQPLLRTGDEVLVPAVSWSTTYYPICQLGGTLKFVDVNPQTLNIDVTKIVEAITPKTKAIFAVNILGNPAEWDQLLLIAKENDLLLLEDNCESLGATFKERVQVPLDLVEHIRHSLATIFLQWKGAWLSLTMKLFIKH